MTYPEEQITFERLNGAGVVVDTRAIMGIRTSGNPDGTGPVIWQVTRREVGLPPEGGACRVTFAGKTRVVESVTRLAVGAKFALRCAPVEGDA